MLSVLSLVKDKRFQEQVTWKTETPAFLCCGAVLFQNVLTRGLQGVERFIVVMQPRKEGREKACITLNIPSRKQSGFRTS